ncbi:hypothetical protein CKW47_07015, partial [Bordetella pertussis]
MSQARRFRRQGPRVCESWPIHYTFPLHLPAIRSDHGILINMRSTLRPLQPARRSQALSWAPRPGVGGRGHGGQAARLGHARVVS